MKDAIIQYLRKGKKNRRLVGVMVAIKDSVGNVGIGVSRCNLKLDKFSKTRGWEIAFGRAHKNIKESGSSLFSNLLYKPTELKLFKERAKRYFNVEVVND